MSEKLEPNTIPSKVFSGNDNAAVMTNTTFSQAQTQTDENNPKDPREAPIAIVASSSIKKEESSDEVGIESAAHNSNSKKRPCEANSELGLASMSSTRPSKKEKNEEYFLEIKWVIGNDVDGEWKEDTFSMMVNEIPKTGGFAKSRAILKNEEGENHELSMDMCLVDSSSGTSLAEISVWYWTVPINLMHFNQLSQELADFCRPLWVDAGRRPSAYCDMAIEFGDSVHSGVKISTLVKAAAGIKGKNHVMYMRDVKLSPGASEKDSRKLLDGIFSTCPAIVIAHETDLTNLGLKISDFSTTGFTTIGKRWYVGPNRHAKNAAMK